MQLEGNQAVLQPVHREFSSRKVLHIFSRDTAWLQHSTLALQQALPHTLTQLLGGKREPGSCPFLLVPCLQCCLLLHH
jgi:hypothetical protein